MKLRLKRRDRLQCTLTLLAAAICWFTLRNCHSFGQTFGLTLCALVITVTAPMVLERRGRRRV